MGIDRTQQKKLSEQVNAGVEKRRLLSEALARQHKQREQQLQSSIAILRHENEKFQQHTQELELQNQTLKVNNRTLVALTFPSYKKAVLKHLCSRPCVSHSGLVLTLWFSRR